MPKPAALELLLKAYRDEIAWLIDRAKEYEENGQPLVAGEYIHRAHNLEAMIQAYERLDAIGS